MLQLLLIHLLIHSLTRASARACQLTGCSLVPLTHLLLPHHLSTHSLTHSLIVPTTCHLVTSCLRVHSTYQTTIAPEVPNHIRKLAAVLLRRILIQDENSAYSELSESR